MLSTLAPVFAFGAISSDNTFTNGRGVFNALHYKDGGVGEMGEIQNATFLEYKADEDPNPKKKTVSNIAIFKRGYASELQQIKGSAQQLHLEFLQNSAEIIADAKKLEQNAIAGYEIPNFFRFLNTKINTDQTAQLNEDVTLSNNNTENASIKPFVIDNTNQLIDELKKVNIILSDENVQDVQSPSTKILGKVLTEHEQEALVAYRDVLEKMLEAKNLETKNVLLTEIQKQKNTEKNTEENTENIELQIQKVIEKIEFAKNKIVRLEETYPVDANKIALLEQDINYLEKEKEMYEDVKNIASPEHTSSSEYDEIFENIWKDGKIIGTKVKNMSSTLVELKNYHKWIGEKMFAGVSTPSNPNVRAVLTASAYRGDISPKELNSALLQMTHNKKSVLEFYEEVAKVMYSKNDHDAQEQFTQYVNQHPEFSVIENSLVDASEFWNDHDLAGNTAQFNEKNPLAETEANSRQAFQKIWGFNIALAYTEYKKLNTHNIKPNELDLQNSLKKNGNALDMSLWIDHKTNTVNDSNEMKNYLSDLLLMSFNIPNATEDEAGSLIESLDIKEDKKVIYKKIISQNWSGNDAEIMLFVQTVKSEFKEEQRIEQQLGIKEARPVMNNLLKNMADTTGTLGESVSYIWDRATSGDVKYMGVVGLLAYLLMKDTSGNDSSKILWFLKRGALWGGGLALANSVADDMFDVNAVDIFTDLISGEDEKMSLSPSGMVLKEMENNKGIDADELSSKEFQKAGVVLSNGNVKETLDWYNACKARAKDESRDADAKVYSVGLPTGMEHFAYKIYEDEGSVGSGHTKEDAAKEMYKFLELYFKNVSLQINPTAGDGVGNEAMGFRSIADEFYYPEEMNNNEYKEIGTNVIKKGYTLGEVMRARTSRESIQHIHDKFSSAEDVLTAGADAVNNFTHEAVVSMADDEKNTQKTDENLLAKIDTHKSQA